jgi:putative ABC transport system permease protein
VLARSPGFTFVALTTLALGIGANTAVFSVVYGVLMRPLPYENGGTLVVLHQQAMQPEEQELGLSATDIADFKSQSETLCGLAEHHTMSFLLYGRQEPERVQTAVVSANFFDLLGVRPLFGRTFIESDDQKGADAVLVLSYKYWRQSHLGDPDIVGKVFTMNDRPHTVIGVLPPIPQYPVENDVYMPTVACPTRSGVPASTRRNFRMLSAFGRLCPGATVAQAKSDISRIGTTLQQSHPQDYPENRGYSARLASLEEDLTRSARPTFLVLLATAGLVLLIACANVANLMLARFAGRRREIAARFALGADRVEVVRQLVTESMLVAVLGGAVGGLLAQWAVSAFVAFGTDLIPRILEIRIDPIALAFSLLVTLLAGLAIGLLPALQASSVNVLEALKEGDRGSIGSSHRLRASLLVAQVSLSLVVLIAAGLFVTSFARLQRVDPGFDPAGVFTARLALPPRYTAEQTVAFYEQLPRRLAMLPGATSAALTDRLPLTGGQAPTVVAIAGRPLPPISERAQANRHLVSPKYFSTLKIPIRAGRDFDARDNARAPHVVIVNETFARRHFPGENPIGRTLITGMAERPSQIVGVVADVRGTTLNTPPESDYFLPVLQRPERDPNILLRTNLAPAAMEPLVREALRAIDPELPLLQPQALTTRIAQTVANRKLALVLLGGFAALALLLASLGVYSVMTHLVAFRTSEIGLRMALGASPAGVLRMVLAHGRRLTLVGIAVGIAGALAVSRLMQQALFDVDPADPLVYLALSVTLLLVAECASWVPARRATRIDPVIALRTE